MNYDHNNLRLKRLQNRLEKIFNLYSAVKTFLNRTATVELEAVNVKPGDKFQPLEVA